MRSISLSNECSHKLSGVSSLTVGVPEAAAAGGGGGITKADLERLIAAAAQTAPAQTIRIEQAPIQITTQTPPKSDETYKM